MRTIAVLAISVATLALGACTEVPTGHTGIETNFGEVVGSHGEGLAWYNPITTDIILMDVRQLKREATTEAYTKDVQQAEIKYAMTYRLDAKAAKGIYQTVGEDWDTKLVPQVVEQVIKNVFGQSEAVKDTINNRVMVQQAIIRQLRVDLAARHVIVEGFEIKDISFSQNFEAAVEAKQVAVENANAARNRTVEIEENAKQTVIKAEAEAKSMSIRAQALANSPALTQYEAVKKWNGALPQNMYGANAIPFIQQR